METIKNATGAVTTTASNMIWGDKSAESKTEPTSGEAGKGTKEDPYDAGNKDSATSSTPDIKAPADENPAASGATTEQKQQGADRPSDAPSRKEADAVAEKKDAGEEALSKRDPNDKSGEPMHMHGAGGAGGDGDSGKENKEADRKASATGQEGGGTHGKEEGTGEKWVKSSGLAVDGGDFDVANAGAGREADRLMEQKGIHKAEGSPAPPPPSGESGTSSSGSKMDKIKEKLHIGKH